MMSRLTIRARLILLSSTLLLVLIATNSYLNRKLADNSAGMLMAADMIAVSREANAAQFAFGEMRYWLADLAVSLLAKAEGKAAAARGRLEKHLDRLARWQPKTVAEVRGEVEKYEDLAGQAVEEYTADRRESGNKLWAQAGEHSAAADRSLAAIAAELTRQADNARQQVVDEAAGAARLSLLIVAVALLAGACLTFLVLRSIATPLKRLVIAMDGLNAGNAAVAIPAAGPDEIGAMARTLAAFRDTTEALRLSLAQFEALRAVGRAVGSTLDLETVLRLIVARAVEFSQAAAGMVFEYDEEAGEFRFRTGDGAEAALTAQLKARPIRRAEGAIGAAAAAGAPVQVPDLATETGALVPELTSGLASLGYRSLLAAPLLHEQDILGGLIVLRREAGSFSKETVSLVEAFATQSALAVRNAKLFEDQRRREEELLAAHEQLKAAQAGLIQAEKMASLGQLTAGVAHEIKNPLNFINNFADLSRDLLDELSETIAVAAKECRVPAADEVDELIATLTSNLGKIAGHGRRADGIVKSMLSHSRGGGGERQRTDLNALAEEALGLAYHGARAQDPGFNVTLVRDFDPDLPPIDLVAPDITRVLLNLFGNGFHAVNKRRLEGGDPTFEPVLQLKTRNEREAVEMRVRDNGIGMSPEVQAKAFMPFFTTKPTGEGTGLGLSISYDIIVQEHHGTIEIDSREREYTEFIVRLPRRSNVAAAATKGAA